MGFEERRDALRSRLATHDLDVVALGYGDHLRYLTGWDPVPGERPLALLVTRGGDLLFVPRLHAADAERLDVPHTAHYRDDEAPGPALGRAATALLPPGPRLAVDGAMRTDAALLLADALGSGAPALAGPWLDAGRARKDADEIAALREASAVTDRALARWFGELACGVSERRAAERLRGLLIEEGAEDAAFVVVGFGPDSAEAHHRPGDRPLADGDAVLVDVGARVRGYVSDVTRVGYVGPPPRPYRTVHALVGSALEAALAATRPGATVAAVDAAARGVIAAAGYGADFRHRVGHGIGLSIHEPPYLTADGTVRLEPGMVVTLEPGVYRMGRFGIRLEEVVLVTEDGHELLSHAPRAIHPLACR